MAAAAFGAGVSQRAVAWDCCCRSEAIGPCSSSSSGAYASASAGWSVRNPVLFSRCVPTLIRLQVERRGGRASLQPPPESGTEQAEKRGSRESDGMVEENRASTSRSSKNELNEAVRKTAATFAPRASTASKNPAPPGSTLYKVFEAQAYIAMAVGGALSFNLLFPSDHPDLWRLMGMWSVWMFTVPSLRARDCSKKEKEALNYLFLAIPLINVTLPLVWKSFAAVWSADILAFFAIYAWKMEWLDQNKVEDS